MSKPYSIEEIEWLKENYSNFGIKYCANFLGRGKSGVASKCAELNLKVSKETISSLCRAERI